MNKKVLEINQIFSLATENHKKNNFDLAESLYKKILKKDSNHFQTIFLLGTLFSQKKNYEEAKAMLSKAIQLQPNHADSLHNLGSALIECGEPENAIKLLNKAIQININHADAYYNLGNAFKQLRNFVRAEENYKLAIKVQPNNSKAYNNLGNVQKELGLLKEAINSYNKAIQIQPNHARAYHNLGNTFKQLGDFEKAKSSYQKSFQYQPFNFETLEALSNLDNEILDLNLKKQIKNVMKIEKITKNNSAYGNFLLAKYELKQKNFENEFNYLIKGHSDYYDFKKKIYEKGVDYWLNQLPAIEQLMNMGKAKKDHEKNKYNVRPSFIVGVPRCGSTLIEKVIASGQKKIFIGEETAIISSIVGDEIIKKQADTLDIKNLGARIVNEYKQKKLILEKNNGYFTDKSLHNFFFIGLIKEIFPLAKIINCKRSAISSIISILKNNLGDVPWAHNLDHIFKYFDIYYKKIDDFKKIFPDFIYEVHLENFVKEPEVESKKLMQFCDLPWDKKCLEFYKRKDLTSRTASNIQIRKPIYKDSKDKNLPYKQFLNKYSQRYYWFN